MKNKITAVALIFPLMMTSSIAYSAETIDTYDALKSAIESAEGGLDVNITGDIHFTGDDAVKIGSDDGSKTADVTIEGSWAASDGSGTSFVKLNGNITGPDRASSEAFKVNKGSSLTLKNVRVQDFIGFPGLAASGAVVLQDGSLTLTAEEGKDIIFENNGVNRRGGGGDISFVSAGGKVLINGDGGKVQLGTGVWGSSGTIEHDGESLLVLGGSSSGFKGSFTNKKGNVQVGKDTSFFGGANVFENGTLEWNSDRDLFSSASLTMQSGTSLVVGADADSPNAKLTLRKGQTTLEKDVSLRTQNSGELVLEDWQDKFTEKVDGNGKLTLKNTHLDISNEESFEEGDRLKVSVDANSVVRGHSKLAFDSLSNAGETDAAKDELDVAGQIDNSGTVSGGKIVASTLNNTGKVLAHGEIILNGDSAEDHTDLTNHAMADLPESGLISASMLSVAGNVENTGTITVTDKITVDGNVKNTERGIVSAAELDVAGDIENQSNLTVSGKLTGNNVTNSGTIESRDIEVSNVQNSGKITASGTLTTTGLTNERTGEISIAGGSVYGLLHNDGTVANTGDLTVAGEVAGQGNFNNSGNVTFSGNGSAFTGVYTQTAGSTKVEHGGGVLLGGTKDIQGGSLTVFADKMYDGLVKLGNGATLDFTLATVDDTANRHSINNDTLTFTGADATAAFTGVDKSHFTLADNIEGSQNNNIQFDNTTLSLEGNDYNYQSFDFNNSVLNLAVDGIEDTIDTHSFHNFHAQNSSVDLNLQLNSSTSLKSDVLHFYGNSSGKLALGKVYLKDLTGSKNSASVEAKVIENEDTDSHVELAFDDTNTKVHIGSSQYSYYLELAGEANDSISLRKDGDDPKTLSDFDQEEGARDFLINGDDGEYTVDTSLTGTADGWFRVYGENKDRDRDILNGNGNSLFKLGQDSKVHLSLTDMTVKNADSAEQGSVLRNESAGSEVTLENLYIKDNKGGAVYNNGSNAGDNSETNPGLYVFNTVFENNASNTEGAAVYNGENGVLYMEDVTFKAGSGTAANDLYNAGTAYANGVNVFESKITNAADGHMQFWDENTVADLENAGEVTFDGVQNTVKHLSNGGAVTVSGVSTTIEEAENHGTLNLGGQNVTVNSLTADSGTVTADANETVLKSVSGSGEILHNAGILSLEGDASGYTGEFTQTAGATVVTKDGQFFGGKSVVGGGVLGWLTQNDLKDSASLQMGQGSTLIVGAEGNETEDSINALLTLKEGSSVDAAVMVANGSSLTAGTGSSLTLNDGSVWSGTVAVSGGDLILNAAAPIQTQTAVLNATSGNIQVKQGVLTVNGGSAVLNDVAVSTDANTSLYITGGEVSLNENDTLNGQTVLTDGTLNYGKVSLDENAALTAAGGNLNVVGGGTLTVDSRKQVADNVQLSIDGDSSVTVAEGGMLTVDAKDSWKGAIALNKGTLNYQGQENGLLTASEGQLNLENGSKLTLNRESEIADAVSMDIQNGAAVTVNEGARLTMNGHTEDKWHGLIENNGGEVRTLGVDSTLEGFAGQFVQTAGNAVFDAGSNMVLVSPNTSVTGGSVAVLGHSKLTFADSGNIQLDSLSVGGESSFSILNGAAQTVTLDSLHVDGTDNFALDIQLNGGTGDQFVVNSLTGANGGTVNVSDFGFIGGLPQAQQVDVQLFDAQNMGDVAFTATDKAVSTPLGDYTLQSLGKGTYRVTLGSLNPDVFRGQASTLAVYSNQLSIDDMILDHMILDNGFGQQALSQPNVDKSAMNRNGGLWGKTYYNDGSLDMSQGLDVDTTAYGVFVGADLPMISLSGGWNFVPTVFAGYNGSKQDYRDIDMKQNGGQGGVMGTFVKNDFVASVMAYGGGYSNKMEGSGYKDSTHNWFAGSAAKAAFNVHVAPEVIVQPTAFVSYNAFGKQDWHSSYGNIQMHTDSLNGLSVAPGVNFIYAPKTWSAYTTFKYVYNIDNKTGGQVENDIDLPDLKMKQGFVEYGIGAAKAWTNRFNSDFRVTGESGGRTGVGFRLGVEYLFDTNNWFK